MRALRKNEVPKPKEVDPDEMEFDLGGENLMKGKIDHSKRAIEHAGLEDMADACASRVYNLDTPEDALLICTMIPDEEYPSMVNFKWGYSVQDKCVPLADLKKIDWSNNLDTIVDYEKGVGMPPMYPFAIVQVVKSHYKKDGIYTEEKDDGLRFYISSQ